MESECLIKAAVQKSPSRWKSSEFLIYYLIILAACYFTIKEVISISSASHPAYPKYSHLLTTSWFGLKIVIIVMSAIILINDTPFFVLGLE